MRADARRNRELLLSTAAELFDERGVEAPLEEIARRAGVGIGTLYRHFPTRDALIESVYRREVEMLCDPVAELIQAEGPEAALSTWMRSFAGYVARKRGMSAAVKAAVGTDSSLFKEVHDRILGAVTALVTNAASAGVIRDDVDPMDLLRALSGICMVTDTPEWTARAGRLVDLLLDGLRYGAPGPSAARA